VRCQLAACAAGKYALRPHAQRPELSDDNKARALGGSAASAFDGCQTAADGTCWCLAYVVTATNEVFLAYPTLPCAPRVSSLLEVLAEGRARGAATGQAKAADEPGALPASTEVGALVRAALAVARGHPGSALRSRDGQGKSPLF